MADFEVILTVHYGKAIGKREIVTRDCWTGERVH
jgi:hypothetical protein